MSESNWDLGIQFIGGDGVSWFTQNLYVGYPLLNKWRAACQARVFHVFLWIALHVPNLDLDIILFVNKYIYIYIIPRPSSRMSIWAPTWPVFCCFGPQNIHSPLHRIQGFGFLQICDVCHGSLQSTLFFLSKSGCGNMWAVDCIHRKIGWVSGLSHKNYQTSYIFLLRKQKAKSANRPNT